MRGGGAGWVGVEGALSVLYVQRRPMGAQVSVERLFEEVRRSLGREIGVEVHVSPYPSRGLWPRLGNLWAAWRAGRGRLCHLTGDVQYLGLVLPRGRFVLTIHDCAVLHRLRGWRRELLRRVWFEWPVRRAGVVTTISEATRQDLERWLPQELWSKLRVVPNCVRAEFRVQPKAWAEGSPIFLQVGTGWNKNLPRVLEALRGLGCRLWIVGPVDAAQAALLASSGLEYRCLGRLSEEGLVEAYGACDAVVFVSLFEGFGLPILEAQATGRPVITGRGSALPEAAGKGALLVDAEEVGEIRGAVERLLREPSLREELVAAGLANVAGFQPGAIAARYEAVYREVAARLSEGGGLSDGVRG